MTVREARPGDNQKKISRNGPGPNLTRNKLTKCINLNLKTQGWDNRWRG